MNENWFYNPATEYSSPVTATELNQTIDFVNGFTPFNS